MIKRLLTVGALAGILSVSAQAQEQGRDCATMDVHARLLQQNPELADRMHDIEEHTSRIIANKQFQRSEVTGTITIPVVVHVVWNTAEQNISDAQVQSQIDVLNEDFRAMNADVSNTPSLFAGRVADTEIEFVLDQIIRVNTKKRSFRSDDGVKFASSGGSDAVSPDTKMNFWICDLGSSLLGYAQFPGGPAATDGIVGHYRYTGTIGTATAPYNLGRTATHEVGHYLNLRHIWGDGGCGVDDFVSDTPVQGQSHGGCPAFPDTNTCDEGAGDEPDMHMNYMDYVYDQCMYMFTTGQKDRMRAIFETGGPRAAMAGNDTGGPGTGNETCATQGPEDVGRQAYVYYSVTVPTGATSLSVSTSGSSGDADLYVKYGSQPTVGDADCASESSSSNESCFISNPTAGTWYVGVYGYRRSSAVTTDICYSVPARGTDGGDVVVELDGIVQSNATAPLALFPNPVQNHLNLNLGIQPAEGSYIRVVSLSGQELMSMPVADVKQGVDVSSLAKGMYLITVQDVKGGLFTQKFIKQ